jgi:hypothetical protein
VAPGGPPEGECKKQETRSVMRPSTNPCVRVSPSSDSTTIIDKQELFVDAASQSIQAPMYPASFDTRQGLGRIPSTSPATDEHLQRALPPRRLNQPQIPCSILMQGRLWLPQPGSVWDVCLAHPGVRPPTDSDAREPRFSSRMGCLIEKFAGLA